MFIVSNLKMKYITPFKTDKTLFASINTDEAILFSYNFNQKLSFQKLSILEKPAKRMIVDRRGQFMAIAYSSKKNLHLKIKKLNAE